MIKRFQENDLIVKEVEEEVSNIDSVIKDCSSYTFLAAMRRKWCEAETPKSGNASQYAARSREPEALHRRTNRRWNFRGRR